MKETLYINGKDAYTTWGVTMADGFLSALMTPNSPKDAISSTIRTKHGTLYADVAPRLAERTLTLMFNLSATDTATFFSRYESFCKELEKGTLEVKTRYQASTLYRLQYVSCTQFTAFVSGIATFTLKCTEPDPTNRDL